MSLYDTILWTAEDMYSMLITGQTNLYLFSFIVIENNWWFHDALIGSTGFFGVYQGCWMWWFCRYHQTITFIFPLDYFYTVVTLETIHLTTFEPFTNYCMSRCSATAFQYSNRSSAKSNRTVWACPRPAVESYLLV